MRTWGMIFWATAATAAALAAPAIAEPAAIDTHQVAVAHYGNDAPWYESRIPFFESSDKRIEEVYYYRWKLYRAHQRDMGERGYVSTEFLDDVGWQLEPWGTLNDATGFHLAEGRWLRDRRYADDYITFMYTGGNDRHFTDYMADSVLGRFKVDGDQAAALQHLDAMQTLYTAWYDHFDESKGLYWVSPLLDATEYTISSIDASGGLDGFGGGEAFRPSINAYMFANARAIAQLARLAGQPEVAQDYDGRADALGKRLNSAMWNKPLEHFVDRYKVSNEFVTYWDPIRGRELAGLLPWTFDMADDTPQKTAAWRHILSPLELGGAAGLRTVEPSYEYYMQQYRYDGGGHDGGRRECQWNGPIWPFQTTQVLLGLANLLDHYGAQDVIDRSDYMRLLRQYTELHYQGDRLDLEENYEPDSGLPIVGIARSHHYFHSGYVDLIMGGLIGIRPRADDMLEINPMLPAPGDPQQMASFRMQNIPYHGHDIAITWDADGSTYGQAGLAVSVDGREVIRQPGLDRILLPLPRKANPPIQRPINQAVQLVRDQFPIGSASSATDPENLHEAIDGRLWFMPEEGNGWSSEPSAEQQWYAIDFGKPIEMNRAELSFFANGGRFAAPTAYRMQYWSGDQWTDMKSQADAPLANGITHVRWDPVSSSKVRIPFDLTPNRAMRLVEAKIF